MTTRSSSSTSPAVDHDALAEVLGQTAFVTMAELTKMGADDDLSLTQLRVLAILRDRQLRMAVLADYLGLEKSTMTGLVDRAEKRGLLQRAPNPGDGRAVDVFLTTDGTVLAEQLHTKFQQSLTPMTDRLSLADRRRLHVLLERMLTPQMS